MEIVPASSSQYLVVPRIESGTSTKYVITKESRSLNHSDFIKLHENVVSSIENLIELIPLDDSDEQMRNNHREKYSI